MQIGQAHGDSHAWQGGRLLQLLHGRAFDPVVWGRNQAHF